MQFYRQRHQIQNCRVHLECNQKQCPEMLEHFGEKVPEESDVWL